MNFSKISKTEGLSNIRRFSEFQVNKLSTNVADKLSVLLKDYNLSKEQLFQVLQTLNMFSADFLNQNISAKYHYESNSIFLNTRLNLCCPDIVVIHECLHFLQSEIENNKVVKMGLYNLKSFTNLGLTFNEAAIQIIASQVCNVKPDNLIYFGMEFNTPSPEYYPLETALMRQISYFTGTYPLFFSTIYSTNLFKDVFSNITSKKIYNNLSNNMNKLVSMQDSFFLTQKKEGNEDIKNNNRDNFKQDIQNQVSEIQKSIFKNAFHKQFNNIKTKQDIKNFRASLINFNNYLIDIPNDNSFEQFRDSITSDLISLEIELEQKGYIDDSDRIKSLSPIDSYNFAFLKTLFYKLKLNREILFRIRQKEEDLY